MLQTYGSWGEPTTISLALSKEESEQGRKLQSREGNRWMSTAKNFVISFSNALTCLHKIYPWNYRQNNFHIDETISCLQTRKHFMDTVLK
jgi:hypothetical protein